MAPIAAVNSDLTIAVSLAGSEADGRYAPTEAEPRATTEWLGRMWRSTTALLERTGPATEESSSAAELVDASKEEPVPKLGSFEVMNRTIDIAQAALARHTLAAYPPDVLVEVPRSACRSLKFYRAAEVIDVGRELAADVLDELEKSTQES
jgi:NTE family protein